MATHLAELLKLRACLFPLTSGSENDKWFGYFLEPY